MRVRMSWMLAHGLWGSLYFHVLRKCIYVDSLVLSLPIILSSPSESVELVVLNYLKPLVLRIFRANAEHFHHLPSPLTLNIVLHQPRRNKWSSDCIKVVLYTPSDYIAYGVWPGISSNQAPDEKHDPHRQPRTSRDQNIPGSCRCTSGAQSCHFLCHTPAPATTVW